MSKKIESALKDLQKALRKHGEVVGARHVSLKRSQRATVKLRAAATTYAAIVHARTGLSSPFAELLDPTLDQETIESLVAERDAIAQTLTGPIPQQHATSL